MPIFGCRSFTPLTTCQDIHPGGPIREGSRKTPELGNNQPYWDDELAGGTGPIGTEKPKTLSRRAREAQDLFWLGMMESGEWDSAGIAKATEVDVRSVKAGLKRARQAKLVTEQTREAA